MPSPYTGYSPRTSSFEWGLDELIKNSVNRTTRGVALRYGGSCGACPGDPADRTLCGQPVLVLSGAGQMRLRIGGARPYVARCCYVHGKLVSDVPFSSTAESDHCAAENRKANAEIFRGVIRATLQTW